MSGDTTTPIPASVETVEAECLCVPIDVQPPAIAGYDATGCETHGRRLLGRGQAARALTGQGDGGFGTSTGSGTA